MAVTPTILVTVALHTANGCRGVRVGPPLLSAGTRPHLLARALKGGIAVGNRLSDAEHGSASITPWHPGTPRAVGEQAISYGIVWHYCLGDL